MGVQDAPIPCRTRQLEVHIDQPIETAPGYATWVQAASHVIYFLATCVDDHLLGYIRDARTPKEAWENLHKIFAATTTARRLQLRQELKNIQQRDMSMGESMRVETLL